ncbi:NERD domain-containing protein [Gimesia sp.]|uniref:nuclease-related domain-containing DEAD/DEAH box helicase n=1 Tax=Gimesia sp. TaxID=2024833 RepID=UPI003A92EB91
MAPSCKIYPEVLPQQVRRNPKLSSEVLIYDLLKEHLGFGWTVFYDVAWLGLTRPDQGPRDGQIDFIVAHPKKGVLLIEVKGGRIRFDGPLQQWISKDRHGEDHDIHPFAQVRRSKHGMLEKLRSLPSLRGKWIQLSHSVCFPSCARPHHAVTPESLPEIIIGSDDLTQLQNRIEEILQFSHGQDGQSFEHGELIVSELDRLIARSVELPNPLAVQSADEHLQMIRLTESQMMILSLLKKVRRAAIGGAAGSGKTFLAVEKARRLAMEGFDTLLACYTEPLAIFLKNLVRDTQNLDVLTVDELAERKTGGVGSDPLALFDAIGESLERPYDAIVVDEGQDLNSDWWLALESCLREGKDSVFYVFHDTHQTLFSGGGVLPDGMTEYPLEENVRNTQAICETLHEHYRGDVPITARGPAGRNVESFSCSSEHELQQLLGKTINRLLNVERLRPKDLVVLTPRRIDQSALTRIKLSGNLQLVVGEPEPKSREIQFASIDQFKGLERGAVIVVELDDTMPGDEDHWHALCYVAFSRPRHHLILMGSEDVLASLAHTIKVK